MPNTAVKAANAESTWGEAPWEDRKPLIKLRSREAGLSREAILKERKRRIKLTESLTPEQGFGVGEGIWNQIIPEKGRIKLTESLTPKQGFGVGGGVSKQIF